jgi:tRNA nucleotidyltransferase (CCA-adding enzyme)
MAIRIETREAPKRIPESFEGGIRICAEIEAHGHAAFIAGGAIRDWIRGEAPHDIDIATSASASEIRRMFPDCIDAGGAKHGTCIIIRDGETFEITTFRGASIERDIEGRDMTICAFMFRSATGEIFAPEGAFDDIEAGIIRFTEDAAARIEEDPARIFRAMRMEAKFGE